MTEEKKTGSEFFHDVMLVEDEAGVWLLLKKILERHGGFRVVAECESFKDAIVAFGKYRPDVVFMDIGIQGENGIECARILTDIEPKTKIIFATAHAEYMPEAFELYAFDYLVKPFDVARVDKTLNRICMMQDKKDEGAETDRIGKISSRLLVKGRESMSFVDVEDIVLVQRENNATVIYTRQESFTTSATMSDIEAKLDGGQFMRSHKSYIINLSEIKRIEPYGRWTWIVTFKDIQKDALITQEKYEEFKSRFS